MAKEFEIQEEYAAHKIVAEGWDELNFAVVRVRICPPNLDPNTDDPISFIEKIAPVAARQRPDWPRESSEAMRHLVERGLHRARGLILLGRASDLDGVTLKVPAREPVADRSDAYLRNIVLNAFKRVFRADRTSGGRVAFDDLGISLVEGVPPESVEYILGRLALKGLIDMSGIGQTPGSRWYKPTAAGLAEADRLGDPDQAPGLLVEEVVAEVERRLSRHSPDLASRLRKLLLKVTEPGELTHLDVGEIAQACDLIIQEFLDLSVFWEGISEEKPSRDRTKDRLSLILKSKVGSETEEGLVKGLGDYLFGWFGPLDKFVNKHRHPIDPEQSKHLHAKRLVLYTYLLMGDLIELVSV